MLLQTTHLLPRLLEQSQPPQAQPSRPCEACPALGPSLSSPTPPSPLVSLTGSCVLCLCPRCPLGLGISLLRPSPEHRGSVSFLRELLWQEELPCGTRSQRHTSFPHAARGTCTFITFAWFYNQCPCLSCCHLTCQNTASLNVAPFLSPLLLAHNKSLRNLCWMTEWIFSSLSPSPTNYQRPVYPSRCQKNPVGVRWLQTQQYIWHLDSTPSQKNEKLGNKKRKATMPDELVRSEWSEATQSCPTLWRPHGLQPTRLLSPWNFPGKNTRASWRKSMQKAFHKL